MLEFVRKTILFNVVFSIGLLALLILSSRIIKSKASFKLSPELEYIIVGHSHAECAFNDSLIPNFKNMSSSGESYFYTYQKVKNMIRDNPQVKTIFVEFTNNQINKGKDQWIWGDYYLSYRYPLYFFSFELEDQILIASKNLKGFINAISLSLRRNISRIVRSNYQYIPEVGGYLYLDKTITDSLKQKYVSDSVMTGKKEVSLYNITYLKKIIEECEENGITVYLVRSPQHPRLPRLNEDQFLSYAHQNFNSTTLLDFNSYPLKDSCFADLEHLNYRGARKFSLWFNSLIQNGLLSSSNISGYIDSTINVAINSDKIY